MLSPNAWSIWCKCFDCFPHFSAAGPKQYSQSDHSVGSCFFAALFGRARTIEGCAVPIPDFLKEMHKELVEQKLSEPKSLLEMRCLDTGVELAGLAR